MTATASSFRLNSLPNSRPPSPPNLAVLCPPKYCSVSSSLRCVCLCTHSPPPTYCTRETLPYSWPQATYACIHSGPTLPSIPKIACAAGLFFSILKSEIKKSNSCSEKMFQLAIIFFLPFAVAAFLLIETRLVARCWVTFLSSSVLCIDFPMSIRLMNVLLSSFLGTYIFAAIFLNGLQWQHSVLRVLPFPRL